MTNYLSFIRNNSLLLGFGFLTVFWGNFGQSFFIAWFGADIQKSLGLSASSYGSAYSSATLLSAFSVVWLGGLIDRVSLKRYAMLVAFGLATAALVLSRVDNLLMLFCGFFLVRLFGQALLPHTGITTMARSFSAARGRAVSIAMSGVPFGEIVLPVMVVTLIAYSGWQTTFLVISVLTVLVLVPALWILCSKIEPHQESGQSANPVSGQEKKSDAGAGGISGRRRMLGDYRYWLALPALMANPFLVTGIFIHQNFLVSSKQWSMEWLATCFIVYGIVHWLSSLASGSLVDRYSGVRMLSFMLLPMLLAVLLIAFVPGWWTAVAIMSLLGMSSGSGSPITSSLWAEVYGTGSLGAIRALNMSIIVFSTAVSPVLFGYTIDIGVSLTGLFAGCAVYVTIAMLMLFFSYPRQRQQAALPERGSR